MRLVPEALCFGVRERILYDGTVHEPLWALFGHGPDGDYDVYDPAGQTTQVLAPNLSVVQPYDPTNGTASDGDLARWRE